MSSETIKEITAIPLKLGDVVNYKGHDDVIIYTGKVTKVISYEKYSHIVLTPLDLSDFINQGIKD